MVPTLRQPHVSTLRAPGVLSRNHPTPPLPTPTACLIVLRHKGDSLMRARPLALLSTALLSLAIVGCSDKPHGYGQERPPVDQLDSRDRGLQSKEVVDASDLLVQKILALPEFNGPNRRPVVVTNLENRTSNANFSYDIFLQRLKSNIGQHGRDRIFLVDNRTHINKVRSSEIETGGASPDTFGQTD